jgi:glycosyltransferase involved in cell wall biosynthesis
MVNNYSSDDSYGGNPLITVYITTHNRFELLDRAVNSVLAQTHSNFELIIVDDCSGDDTSQYIKSLCDRDDRVVYIRNEENLGANASRNREIFAARGVFVTGLDDDDYFLPKRLSRFLTAWGQKKPNTVAICSNSVFRRKDEVEKISRRPRFIRRTHLIDSNLVGNQIFTDTARLLAVGGFDISFGAWQDLELWFRMVGELGEIECIEDATYIVDEGHILGRISNGKIERILEACERIGEKFNLTDRERKVLRLQVGLYENQTIKFLDLIVKAFRRPTIRNFKQIINIAARARF